MVVDNDEIVSVVCGKVETEFGGKDDWLMAWPGSGAQNVDSATPDIIPT